MKTLLHKKKQMTLVVLVYQEQNILRNFVRLTKKIEEIFDQKTFQSEQLCLFAGVRQKKKLLG
jgi:hypothetical protein